MLLKEESAPAMTQEEDPGAALSQAQREIESILPNRQPHVNWIAETLVLDPKCWSRCSKSE